MALQATIDVALDIFIENALAEDRAPARFILTPSVLADLIDAEAPLFRRVRCHGHDRNLYDLYPSLHPEHCPPVTIERQAGYEITVEAMRGMIVLVNALGLSHYRNVPLVVQGEGYRIDLESRAW